MIVPILLLPRAGRQRSFVFAEAGPAEWRQHATAKKCRERAGRSGIIIKSFVRECREFSKASFPGENRV